MEKVVFADTFTKNLKKIFKVPTVTVDNPYFQLHYKVTGLSLLFCSIIVTGSQFFGEPIRCIQRDDVPEKLLNTYCWIEGTFSLPKAYNKKVGTEIVYEGVDKFRKGDAVIEHAYYQWVCFVLFLQAMMFCFPYVLLRIFDGGKIKYLVQTLKRPIWDKEKSKESKMELLLETLQCLFLPEEIAAEEEKEEEEENKKKEEEEKKKKEEEEKKEKEEEEKKKKEKYKDEKTVEDEKKKKEEEEKKKKEEEKKKKNEEKEKKMKEEEGKKLENIYKLLAVYYINLSKCHTSYAIKFIFCEILNIVNVLGQIFLINRFLGGYFTNYGVEVVRYANMDQKDRIDPMIKLFPRMSKCTFHRFGYSGDVQKHDALCLLPLNIINEKIFVVMWFWLVLLATLGVLMLIYRLLLVVSHDFRGFALRFVSCVTKDEFQRFMPIRFGDWFMLHLIAENIEINHFRGFLKKYEEYKNLNDRKVDFSKDEPAEPTKTGLFHRGQSYSVQRHDRYV